MSATVLKDDLGQPVAIAKTERDVTERKQAEAALIESERFAHSTLDGLSAHIAILDESGIILAINQSWRDFAAANGSHLPQVGEGADYLRTCEKDFTRFCDDGPVVAAGIRGVLAKQIPQFTLEYPCHSSVERRWFVVRVTPFPGNGPSRAVVAHENITKQKELERQVLEAASLEQRRIGQDLHDTVGQELTALNLQAGDLAEMVQSNPAEAAKQLERMVQGLHRSRRELRAVLRGLLPVAVDSEGLMAALSDLADRVRQEGITRCEFDCPRPVSVTDNLTATHLYLIAQEAVHNALKHARPTSIRISLEWDDLLIMRVQDDGSGVPPVTKASLSGLGMRIMQNRAAIIGATLTTEPAEPTGTLLTCSLERRHHDSSTDAATH